MPGHLLIREATPSKSPATRACLSFILHIRESSSFSPFLTPLLPPAPHPASLLQHPLPYASQAARVWPLGSHSQPPTKQLARPARPGGRLAKRPPRILPSAARPVPSLPRAMRTHELRLPRAPPPPPPANPAHAKSPAGEPIVPVSCGGQSWGDRSASAQHSQRARGRWERTRRRGVAHSSP